MADGSPDRGVKREHDVLEEPVIDGVRSEDGSDSKSPDKAMQLPAQSGEAVAPAASVAVAAGGADTEPAPMSTVSTDEPVVEGAAALSQVPPAAPVTGVASADAKVPLEWLPQKKDWCTSVAERRELEVLTTYVPVIEEHVIGEKLRTTKTTHGRYVDVEQLRELEVLDGKAPEDTKTHDDKILEALRNGAFKRPGEEVIVHSTWGLDARTTRLINDAVERALPPDVHFVEDVLVPIINSLPDEQAPFISASLTALREKACVLGKPEWLQAADRLEAAVMKKGEDCFRIHPKGLGVICNVKAGFEAHELVAEYFGEVYTPWRWFEKQDAVKVVKKDVGLEGMFGDFYNIMLERHPDDPRGFDVLFVDPIRRGNFASRLSHSCNPNCSTITMAVDGRFTIAMVTIRPIAYGEELTFDYNCVTESQEEWKASACLCGSHRCRGLFLYYASAGTFQHVMSTHHHFLHRCASLLRACIEPVTAEDRDLIVKHRILDCALPASSPEWLVKFAAQILHFAEEERRLLPGELTNMKLKNGASMYDQRSAVIEAGGVLSNRVQNLVITLDKLRYVFRKQKAQNSPLRLLTSAELIAALWAAEQSFINRVWENLGAILDDATLARFAPFRCVTVPLTDAGVQLLMTTLRGIRDVVRTIPYPQCVAIADLLTMTLHTKVWFTSNKYDRVVSTPVEVTGQDIGDFNDVPRLPKPKSVTKSYDLQYIWGQCVFWDRQTIAKPSASLAAQRFGTVSLPDVESCFLPAATKYNAKERTTLLQFLREKPSRQWPSKNPMKAYGSPWLDETLGKPSFQEFLADMDAWTPPPLVAAPAPVQRPKPTQQPRSKRLRARAGMAGVAGAAGDRSDDDDFVD